MEIKSIRAAVCPICGGKVVQRKSIATYATAHNIPHCELKWKCTQCETNFSAEVINKNVSSKRVYNEQSTGVGIGILGNAMSRREGL